MNTFSYLQRSLPIIEQRIGYAFKDKVLLTLAFIHCSFTNENRNVTTTHNERLEFLGDAILGAIISDFIYRHFPQYSEGKLSYLRALLVGTSTCTLYLKKINVESFLLMGRGESANRGRGRNTIIANLFEALIGAIYIDGGVEEARSFFFGNFYEEVTQIIENPERNWKAELQDFCQRRQQKPPEYSLAQEDGPEHSKVFFVEVKLGGILLGKGRGGSKKGAEQRAAKEAMENLAL